MELGLQPTPNYLAAMQSGAGLGLALRKQDVEEQRAADQLRRSYAGLAATQEAARMRAAAISAGNAIRQAQKEAMIQHYQNIEDIQNRASDKATTAKMPLAGNVGGMDIIYNPASGHFVPKPRLTGEQLVEDESLKQRMAETSKALAGTVNAKAKKDLMSQYSDLLSQRKALVHPPDATQQYQPGSMNPLPDQGIASPISTTTTNEVVKPLKNGRKAVFDAGTKKFLRYTDGQ